MNIKMAFRNLAKNRRRSLVTCGSIALGFLALSLFEGYFFNVYAALEDQAIVGERLGHLTVARSGYFEAGAMDPDKYVITPEELAVIRARFKDDPEVRLVSPRLNVSGLVSNGKTSTIFMGEALDPADMAVLRGEKYAGLPGMLPAGRADGVVMGDKLGRMLGLEKDGTAVLLTSTVGGMVNAVDASVAELANTGSSATDDKFVLMPMALAAKAMDFEGASRVVLLAAPGVDAEVLRTKVVRVLEEAGLSIEVKTWKDLSVYYGQVKGMFDLMYLFISVVVILVVAAGVMNTMGMAVYERTREIGTLMALGMRRRSVMGLFVAEGALLTVIGCVVGALLAAGLGYLINEAGIKYTPPDASAEAEFMVDILFENLLGSTVVLGVMGALAAFGPARRAARRPIVDALGHV